MGIVTIMGNIVAVTQYDPERIAEKYLELYEERSECEMIYR